MSLEELLQDPVFLILAPVGVIVIVLLVVLLGGGDLDL